MASGHMQVSLAQAVFAVATLANIWYYSQVPMQTCFNKCITYEYEYK
jgi:hypothetical protein